MINRVILIGRLTKDPELRYTPAGVAVTQFTLAVNRPYKDQNGEREADFINIVAWRQLAELCANYLRKGRLAGVEGRIQVRNYENNEGRRVYVTEIVADNVQFLESPNSTGGGGRESGMPNRDEGYAPSNNSNNNNNSNSYGRNSNTNSNSRNNNNNYDPFSDDGKPIDISDDDLPF